jgi:hypothetical protein
MFDLLIDAEVIVDDVSLTERVFVDALGFPPPRASWSSTAPAGSGRNRALRLTQTRD